MTKDYVVECAEAGDRRPLIVRLRGGYEISKAQRQFLADYLEGKRGARGRGKSPRRRWEARRHYRLFFHLTHFEDWQRDHAYDEVARVHGISRRTAVDMIKLIEKDEHGEAVRVDSLDMSASAKAHPEAALIISKLWEEIHADVLAGTYSEPQTLTVQK